MLAACTHERPKKTVTGWVTKPATQLFKEWGMPTTQQAREGGGYLAIYDHTQKIKTTDVQEPSGSDFETRGFQKSNEKIISIPCRHIFAVDAKNLIENVTVEGDGCI